MSGEVSALAPEFIGLEEAAAMTSGTRVTFIPSFPAMYSEALKNVCYVSGIPLVRVLHPMMGSDKETGLDRQTRFYELKGYINQSAVQSHRRIAVEALFADTPGPDVVET